MKILWHSNSPSAPTNYGHQTRIFTPRLARAGHAITLSSFYGCEGGAQRNEDGLTELPRGADPYGNDIIESHQRHVGADLVISLIDPFMLDPGVWTRFPWAAWLPMDAVPIHSSNLAALRAARWVIATSHFSEQQLRSAGFDPLYVPAGVETNVYQPVDRAVARDEFSRFTERDLTDKFVVISAAPKGMPSRKHLAGMMELFAWFAADHPDALFYLHIEARAVWQGDLIMTIAQAYGVADKIVLPSQYAVLCGLVNPTLMNHLYNAADVCLLLGQEEGSAIQLIEAQSAGCPIIATASNARNELIQLGWQIPPLRGQEQGALREVYHLTRTGGAEVRREQAREWAQAYDADQVMQRYWEPALARIAHDLRVAEPDMAESTLPHARAEAIPTAVEMPLVLDYV